jgi:hypothetical protein
MTMPFSYVEAPRLIGGWPVLPAFSTPSEASVVPRVIRTRAALLGVQQDKGAGFDVRAKTFYMNVDAVDDILITFSSGAGTLSLAQVVTEINAITMAGPLGANVAKQDNGFLKLESPTTGEGSYLEVLPDTTSDNDSLSKLGLFGYTESYAGEIESPSQFDPDRQRVYPGQLLLSESESLEARTINRAVMQIALNADYSAMLLRKKQMAETISTDVTNPGAGFYLSDVVHTGSAPAPSPFDLEDIVKILDSNGDEIAVESTSVRNAGVSLTFAYDATMAEQRVTAGTSVFLPADVKGDIYVKSSDGALGTLANRPLKILKYISGTIVIVRNVDTDGTRVQVNAAVTGDVVTFVVDTARVNRLLTGPAGTRVEGLDGSKKTGTVVRVELNNRVVCAGTGLEFTTQAIIGDKFIIAGHTGTAPYNNNGNYRVSAIIDDTTLELVTEDFGPVMLNPSGLSMGTFDLRYNGSFYDTPYVEPTFSLPAGTYKVIYRRQSSLDSISNNPAAFSSAPLRYMQETDAKIQKAIQNILGPSASSWTDVLYDDYRLSLEDLDYRLDSEHDETGNHTDILANSLKIGYDPVFSLAMESGNPTIRFDTSDTLIFDRASSTWRFNAGATAWNLVTVDSTGIQIDNSAANASVRLRSYGALALFNTYRSLGTYASPLAVTAGTILGIFGSGGHDGTNWSAASRASMRVLAAETFTSGAQGTYITFLTTTAGTLTAGERMRIADNGYVGIGNTPSYNLDVTGSIRSTIAYQNESAMNWNYGQQIIRRRASNATTTKMLSFLLDADDWTNTTLTAQWNAVLYTAANPTTGSTSASTTHLTWQGPGNYGIGSYSPRSKLSITIPTAEMMAAYPLAGSPSTNFSILNENNYGLNLGVLSSGQSFISSQRVDGVATVYDLLLNPSGGYVGISRSSAAYPLDVGGSARLKTTGSVALYIDGAAGTDRGVIFSTSANQRWFWNCDGTGETGSDAGSDMTLHRYNDAGAWLGTSIRFRRNNGLVQVMTGQGISRDVDNGGLVLSGGSAQSSGAHIELYGASYGSANSGWYDADLHTFRNQASSYVLLTLSNNSNNPIQFGSIGSMHDGGEKSLNFNCYYNGASWVRIGAGYAQRIISYPGGGYAYGYLQSSNATGIAGSNATMVDAFRWSSGYCQAMSYLYAPDMSYFQGNVDLYYYKYAFPKGDTVSTTQKMHHAFNYRYYELVYDATNTSNVYLMDLPSLSQGHTIVSIDVAYYQYTTDTLTVSLYRRAWNSRSAATLVASAAATSAVGDFTSTITCNHTTVAGNVYWVEFTSTKATAGTVYMVGGARLYMYGKDMIPDGQA